MEYAGFWRRSLALVLDLLVQAPVVASSVLLFRVSLIGAIASVLLTAIAFAYPIYFLSRWGQTVGKMAAKIKVVRVDGGPISLRQALLRSSVEAILWIAVSIPTIWILATWDGPAWSSLGWRSQRKLVSDRNPFSAPYAVISQVWLWSELVVLLFNKKRRALHDFIAGTVVIKVPPQERTFGIGVPSVEPIPRG